MTCLRYPKRSFFIDGMWLCVCLCMLSAHRYEWHSAAKHVLQVAKQRPPRPHAPLSSPLISTKSTPFGIPSAPASSGASTPPWQGYSALVQPPHAAKPEGQQLRYGRRHGSANFSEHKGPNSHGAPSAGLVLQEGNAKQENAQLAGPSNSEIELQDVDPSYHGGDIRISVRDEAAPSHSSEAAGEAWDADGRCVDVSEHAPLLRS